MSTLTSHAALCSADGPTKHCSESRGAIQSDHVLSAGIFVQCYLGVSQKQEVLRIESDIPVWYLGLKDEKYGFECTAILAKNIKGELVGMTRGLYEMTSGRNMASSLRTRTRLTTSCAWLVPSITRPARYSGMHPAGRLKHYMYSTYVLRAPHSCEYCKRWPGA